MPLIKHMIVCPY